MWELWVLYSKSEQILVDYEKHANVEGFLIICMFVQKKKKIRHCPCARLLGIGLGLNDEGPTYKVDKQLLCLFF